MEPEKIIFSARRNSDGTYRGLAWRGDEKEPIVMVGINSGDDYYDRKEAIAAAKAETVREGFVKP